MRIQRSFRSQRSYRPTHRSDRNRSPKANYTHQDPIINKLITLHNRMEEVTIELNQKKSFTIQPKWSQ